MPKNYYLILGVTADASREDIRAAYRRRALELHPDRSGLESGPFREAQEAYTVLSDPNRRRAYDRQFSSAALIPGRSRRQAEPLVAERRPAEPLRPTESAGGLRAVSLRQSFESYRPSFEELFDRWWSNFEPWRQPKQEHLESLMLEIVLSPAEARLGGHVRVEVPAPAICPSCAGHGAIGLYQCWQCQGHGTLTMDYPLEIHCPAGLRDGHVVRIPLTGFGIQNFYLTVLFRVSFR